MQRSTPPVVKSLEGISILELKGDLDLRLLPDIADAFAELLAQGECRVVIDLKDAGFVGSTAIALFLDYALRFRKRGGDMSVCGISREVRNIFELLGIEKVLSVFGDAASAIDATRKTPTGRSV